MKVLHVDDDNHSILILEHVIEELGFTAINASSGESALELAAMEHPDIILMDVHMLGMNGYEAALQLKSRANNRHLPIIFVTASTEDDILTKCVSIGDDYIAKPINFDIVMAKLKAHARVVTLYKHLAQQNQELTDYRTQAEFERSAVESIFEKHQINQLVKDEGWQVHLSPKSLFSGDILLTDRSPSNDIYIMMGDVTGHGLPAAVGSIPLYEVFRNMVQQRLGVGTIAAEMNRTLKRSLPVNMLIAANIMCINHSRNRITVWSGGMPDNIISNVKGELVELIKSKHAPLAMLSDIEFSQAVTEYTVDKESRIYLTTDGIEESRNPNEEMFTAQRLRALFNGDSDNMFKRIIQAHNEFIQNSKQKDDISLLEINFSANKVTNNYIHQPLKRAEQRKKAVAWTIHVELTPDDLRRVDPVQQIITLLKNALCLDVHQDYISTILSELFNNALEHGLLHLDSSMKKDTDGYFEYYQQREQQLKTLTSGFISIHISYCPNKNHAIIEVENSGEGFQYKVNHNSQYVNNNAYGHGLHIIENLCSSLYFDDNGRKATAIYQIVTS